LCKKFCSQLTWDFYRHKTVSNYLNINTVNCVETLNVVQPLYVLGSPFPIPLSDQSTFIVYDYLRPMKAT
ncbi:hypothetical protein, partial [Moorena sp. SIO2C4]|uniref:hypothetical protein n=1 Tax=Moorena sp. SIO2C4 TaxID=2607824 RepID=UPI00257F8BAF